MALGAFVAWIWIPELQEEVKPFWKYRENRKLEELGEGFSVTTAPLPDGKGQVFGFRASPKKLFRGILDWWNNRHVETIDVGETTGIETVAHQPQ